MRGACWIAFGTVLLLVAGCSDDAQNLGDLGDVPGGGGEVADAVDDITLELLPAGPESYPELLMRITAPSGSGSVSLPGSIVSLSGIVFGETTAIAWTNLKTGATGTATVTPPFWRTDGITLVVGDNEIDVTATGPAGASNDSLVVTYNPGFLFPRPLQVQPSALFSGEPTEVHMRLELGVLGSVPSILDIHQVNPDGTVVKNLGHLLDDGQIATSSDEIAKDGVFSLAVTVTCTAGTPFIVRAAAAVKDFAGNIYPAYSQPVRFDCVPHLTAQACSAHQATLVKARAALASGGGSGASAARAAAIAALKTDAAVAEVAAADEIGGVWVRWNDGVLGAVNPTDPALRGADASTGTDAASGVGTGTTSSVDQPVQSKRTLLLSPFSKDFGDDETQTLGAVAGETSCPAFMLDGPYKGEFADLAAFRKMGRNGLVAIATHSDVYFKGLSAAARTAMGWHHTGAHEVLWTGQPVDCSALTDSQKTCSVDDDCKQWNAPCILTHIETHKDGKLITSGFCADDTQFDLMTGRAVMGDTTYAFTPGFVQHYAVDFPDSVVYLGGCRTLYNGSMAAAFLSNGAKAVAGYSGPIGNRFAIAVGGLFFTKMVHGGKNSGGAYGLGYRDPDHPDSSFRLVGGHGMTFADPEILNASFETGDLTAWEQNGDGRVLTTLGTARPVQGKFMGIISTGLGYTTNTGSIEQTFCIPAQRSRMSFYWKYYSEEFSGYCGSAFQDHFDVTLKDASGQETTVLARTVNDLCWADPSACNAAATDCADYSKCNGKTDCGADWVGLTDARDDGAQAAEFDQGHVWYTPWESATWDVSNLAGQGPVTLRFKATDTGDSAYDTAVLLDAITFD